MDYSFKPIGLVHSPFQKIEEVPREKNLHPEGFQSIQGTLEIFPEFAAGLEEIDGFTYLYVIFVFHQAQEKKLISHPPHDGQPKGVFATRSPRRPNPLGLTIVRLLSREGRFLHVQEIDMIEGTPILDIKPYTPKDIKSDARFGWLEKFQT
ncbi:MAG: tRNA (N6-threonylcarbamoyladenosine(37)-N6)-methyltransferase TrmO [Candidatus Aminicenantes bacterium 4484_214]|nr:tRNA (N6-threonylcarbamoyladenosine(37)-N6)-methyltransferase TrmO [Candidatus Aminicenantes bacterium]OQX53636.1 MAG: tRNA (N6-threonylcarbamoyladenosine(37)-N6)-methyltransferase TrmO [Candidatus Aminicenantes bacterium 4484_214]